MAQKKKTVSSKKKKVNSKEDKNEITPLAKLMIEHRISPTLLEETSGLSRDALYRVKTGKRKNPEVQTMKKIVDAINKIASTNYKIDDLI
jgi:DNA-binding Xre family transcriptional regulator